MALPFSSEARLCRSDDISTLWCYGGADRLINVLVSLSLYATGLGRILHAGKLWNVVKHYLESLSGDLPPTATAESVANYTRRHN
jgi:hypothetical protein